MKQLYIVLALFAALFGGLQETKADTWYEFNLQNSHKQFLSNVNLGGGAVNANGNSLGAGEMMRLHDQDGGPLRSNHIVQIQAPDGLFWSAEGGGGDVINANRPHTSGWEAFVIIKLNGGDGIIRVRDSIALRSLNGQYVQSSYDQPNNRVRATGGGIGDWERFTIVCYSALINRNLQWPTDNHHPNFGYTHGSEWAFLSGHYDKVPYLHVGIDILVGKGSRVLAAESGYIKEVYDAGSGTLNGKTIWWHKAVTMEHYDQWGRSYTTNYTHVDPSVSPGQWVDRGKQIATVADMGGNTHLHYGIRNAPYSNVANRGALPHYIADAVDEPVWAEFTVDPFIYTPR